MAIFTVSWSEIEKELDSSEGLLFRGQTREYPSIIASGFRGQNVLKQSQVFQTFAEGSMIPGLERLGFDFRRFPYEQLISLLQHYDHISPLLDVTFNPRIALWFASHEFIERGDRVIDIGQHYVRRISSDIRRRESGDAIIYTFNRTTLEEFGLVDFRTLPFPILMGGSHPGSLRFNIRPLSQEAALVGNRVGHMDYLPHVINTYRIPLESLPDDLYQLEELYPARSIDPILDTLLNFCFNLIYEDNGREVIARWVEPFEFPHDGDPTIQELRSLLGPPQGRDRFSDVCAV